MKSRIAEEKNGILGLGKGTGTSMVFQSILLKESQRTHNVKVLKESIDKHSFDSGLILRMNKVEAVDEPRDL